jgi:hypothetical protein
MRDDIPRNGGGTGYGGGSTPEAARRPAPRRAVPPFEAAWLRAVGCSGTQGAAPNGARPDAPPSPPAPSLPPSTKGNGHPATGVDSTRGRH